MNFIKTNPFSQFNIESSEYLEKDVAEYKQVEVRTRALIFILDYSLLSLFIYLTIAFIKIFTPEVPIDIIYITITFYSLIFVAIEYYFDATIFKVLFKIRSMSTSFKKIGIHFYILKFIFRPLALIFALVYLKFCFAILLWIFGIYKLLFKFLNGEMKTIWYDEFVKQLVIKIPKQNG